MAARTSADGCQKVRRVIKTANLVVVACVVLLSGCTTTTNQPTVKPAEKIASVPPAAPTNNVALPKPELVAPVPTPELNLEVERNALLETDLSFSRTSEEKGAAQAFYEFFAADGVNLCAGELPIRGRDAIKVHLAAGPQGFFTWQPTAADVSKTADMGFTWGTAIFQGKGADDKPRINHSKYVTVWKKQNNGRWKVVLFSTSPSPPPTERRQ
jgi:ketosteroid isomerase-like protein